MFSTVFTQLLKDRNITSYRLSKDLNISESLIWDWRKGRKKPGYNYIKKLADYFQISADYLLERTDDHVGK
jgi:transcriptional regulator with XRE-family HTH domain